MAKQFWLGDIFVDLSRNEIRTPDGTQTVPPKVAQILAYLAAKPRQVVSYEELLTEVWPGVVVSTNTLNKTVAQLRKALSFVGQQSSLIKTHSKQGYSLESEVRFENKPTDSDEVQAPPKTKSKTSFHKNAYLLSGFIALLGIVFWVFQSSESYQWKVKDFHYFTASDDMEFDPIYSTSGDFILFNRYTKDLNRSHLWAIEIATQKQFILTQEPGNYAQQSLSPENEKLAFIRRDRCALDVVQTICYQLMQLDFRQALQTPQKPTELMRSESSVLKKPIWIDNEHIALMQQIEEKWRVIIYSSVSGAVSSLYEVQSGNLVTFSWSPELQLFAVIHYQDNVQSLVVLEKNGNLHAKNTLKHPANVPTHVFVYPEFIPGTQLLGFGDGSSIYTLSLDGVVSKTELALEGKFGNPTFHLDGKRMVLVKGQNDIDVNQLSLIGSSSSESQNPVLSSKILSRSTSLEDMAKFSPDGNSIAMITERTGQAQILLLDQENKKVISRFTKGTYVQNLFWDSPGSSLLVLADRELRRVGLDSSASVFSFDFPIIDLFAWDSNNNTVVANIVSKGRIQCVQINLETKQFNSITERAVLWAAKSTSEELIYLDDLNRLWKHSGFEDVMLATLTNVLDEYPRFLVSDNTLWGIDGAKYLWSYTIDEDTLTRHGQLPKNTEYLTDIRGNNILFSRLVSVKKEVMEIEFEDNSNKD